MASKGPAEREEPVEVLFALHPNFNLTDFSAVWEALYTSLHNVKDESTRAFELTIAAAEPKVQSEQGVIIGTQVAFKEAYERLSDFDVLVVVGGGTAEVLKNNAEPLPLIKAFADLQLSDPGRERTLMSICTGALFLAKQGILSGLSATTHPDYLTKFEILCSEAATRDLAERTDVVEDARYVVNNLRFDIGDEDENPYVRRKSEVSSPSVAGRKGSMSFKGSNTRRESIARRAAMRLGGLRVITSGGVSAGVDAALYLVGALVSDDSAAEVARVMQWTWTKGLVVDGLDV